MNRLEIKNISESQAEVFVYGFIGEYDEVSASGFINDIASLDGKDITVRINSRGGDVFTAQAIHTALKRHTGNALARIDGVCASAATFIASACARVEMPVNGVYMVHKPLVSYTAGNAKDLRKQADVLDVIENTMIPIYVERTGKTEQEIRDLLDEEKYMTAQEALDYGFIDAIETNKRINAKVDGEFLNYGDEKVEIKNIPQDILNAVKSLNEKPKGDTKPMDLAQFKAQHGDVAKAHAEEIKASTTLDIQNAIKAERQRVLDIQNTAFDGQSELVAKAINEGTPAGEFAIQANQAMKAAEQSKKDNFLAKTEADRKQTEGVQPSKAPESDEPLSDEDKILNALDKSFA